MQGVVTVMCLSRTLFDYYHDFFCYVKAFNPIIAAKFDSTLIAI